MLYPREDQLAAWRRAARGGEGSPWLRPAEAEALVRHALDFGEGVSLMEAVAPRFREPVRDTGWEILGDDPDGENWQDHRDPYRACELFRRKLAQARRDGAVLEYKIWLSSGGD